MSINVRLNYSLIELVEPLATCHVTYGKRWFPKNSVHLSNWSVLGFGNIWGKCVGCTWFLISFAEGTEVRTTVTAYCCRFPMDFECMFFLFKSSDTNYYLVNVCGWEEMWYYEVLYMNTKAVELGPPRDPKNVQGEFR